MNAVSQMTDSSSRYSFQASTPRKKLSLGQNPSSRRNPRLTASPDKQLSTDFFWRHVASARRDFCIAKFIPKSRDPRQTTATPFGRQNWKAPATPHHTPQSALLASLGCQSPTEDHRARRFTGQSCQVCTLSRRFANWEITLS